MLNLTTLSGFAYNPSTLRGSTLKDVLVDCGQWNNIMLCLDAADGNSFTSGQSWLDTSGNGYDFFRGTNNTIEASDPTFNGVANAKSRFEYWSFDGGDRFTYDSAIETWMQNLHKAGAKGTFLIWVYMASVSTLQGFFGTLTSAGNGTGFSVRLTANRAIQGILYNNNTLVTEITAPSPLTITNQWVQLAISFDITTATGCYTVNNTGADLTLTVGTPATGAASSNLSIGSQGSGGQPMGAGSRIAAIAFWDRMMSKEEIFSIYDATRTRFEV